jgi:Nucleotidyltransferase domain.
LALLFGSYAKNTATKQSDIDVFVETHNRDLKNELMQADYRLSLKIGSYEKESALIREIERCHVVIKGVEEFYEKNQFFS